MEKWVLLFFALFPLKAFAQVQPPDSWVGIDCGADQRTETYGVIWETDESFIKTGTNHFIPKGNSSTLTIINTLRVFKQHNKNCYTLSVSRGIRYFLRATFFYANYDGLSNPPTFDLEIDGNKWITVVSSSNVAQYYEILYRSQGPNVSVCLARTQADHFPFINSLEAWPILYNMYTGMNPNLAWLSTYRYNYGTDEWVVGFLGLDKHNRIWEPVLSLPGASNTTADPGTHIIWDSNEQVPNSVMINAIEAENPNSSLVLSIGPVKTMKTLYLEAYFTEVQRLTYEREIEVAVNSKPIDTVTLSYESCTVVRAVGPVTDSNLTIELTPQGDSQLPAIISAIEIYTASDPLVTTATPLDDRNGLASLINGFEQLSGWSGEPCLPADTVWQWLGCKGNNPPRVTSINLSGYDLKGPLPDFSQMQALQHIDLSNNSLNGEIPYFLGLLPNLTTLDLSHNDFSGKLPPTISGNSRLTYKIDGNPNLDTASKNRGMIIGLAVGIPLIFVLLILSLVYYLLIKRRPPNQGPNQTTGPESGNGNLSGMDPNQTTGSQSGNGVEPGMLSSTEQFVRPTAPPMDEDEDYAPVPEFDTNPNHQQTMVPDMDLEELEELIDQYEDGGTRVENLLDDDYVEVGEDADNDESMVPDMDFEELDDLIQQEKHKENELTRNMNN